LSNPEVIYDVFRECGGFFRDWGHPLRGSCQEQRLRPRKRKDGGHPCESLREMLSELEETLFFPILLFLILRYSNIQFLSPINYESPVSIFCEKNA
jgi:hypothetical protein